MRAEATGRVVAFIHLCEQTNIRVGVLPLEASYGALTATDPPTASVLCGHIDTPKNGRSRVVPMTNNVHDALKHHRHLVGPLVFCNVDGACLTDNQTKRRLYRACRKAFLEKFGWHVLRHTFANSLAINGAPLKAIQELLGHASIDMTDAVRASQSGGEERGHVELQRLCGAAHSVGKTNGNNKATRIGVVGNPAKGK